MKKLKPLDNDLLKELIQIVEQGKSQVVQQVNSTLNLVYWQVGHTINEHIIKNDRAEYGKQIFENLSIEMSKRFGRSFSERNLHRMSRFAETFSDFETIVTLSSRLTWSQLRYHIACKRYYGATILRSKNSG